jgi:hypothetical protein
MKFKDIDNEVFYNNVKMCVLVTIIILKDSFRLQLFAMSNFSMI